MERRLNVPELNWNRERRKLGPAWVKLYCCNKLKLFPQGSPKHCYYLCTLPKTASKLLSGINFGKIWMRKQVGNYAPRPRKHTHDSPSRGCVGAVDIYKPHSVCYNGKLTSTTYLVCHSELLKRVNPLQIATHMRWRQWYDPQLASLAYTVSDSDTHRRVLRSIPYTELLSS